MSSQEEMFQCAYCKFFIDSSCEDYMDHLCFREKLENLPIDKSFALVLSAQRMLELVEDPSSTQPAAKSTETSLDDEMLISMVQSKRALWDHRLPLTQRSPAKIKQMWETIAQELEGSFSVEVIKKRWRQLRDDFMRSHKKSKAYVPSGSGLNDVPPKPSFKFYELMKFLNSTMDNTSTVSNINLTLEGTPLLHPSTPVSGRETGRKRKVNPATNETETEIQKQILKSLNEDTTKKPDGIDGFLMLLGEGLRRLPQRNRSKIEINFLQMLADEEKSVESTVI